MTAAQAGSSDFLFYYDQVPVTDAIAAEIFCMLTQQPGEMFYNRRWGCDVKTMENIPNALSQQVNLRSAILAGMGLRNARVTDGRGGLPDRRAVTSWNAIDLKADGENLDIQVSYIELGDLSQMKKATIPGAGR